MKCCSNVEIGLFFFSKCLYSGHWQNAIVHDFFLLLPVHLNQWDCKLHENNGGKKIVKTAPTLRVERSEQATAVKAAV